MIISPIMKDAIIRFIRIIIAATLVALATAVLSVDLTQSMSDIAAFLVQATFAGLIHAIAEFARNFFAEQIAVVSTKPRAGAQQARAKTFLDYLPI